MTDYIQRPGEKNAIIALLLCFFLFWLGAHNWYLGRSFRAILQIGLAVVGLIPFLGWPFGALLAVWAFIEFIMILIGNGRDGQGRPVTL
ncbi:NINE protein [Temperatibacter marinus]|uniref:NINE protein n=1 Tax=Temperatibacter marinus TaxID=1456591 RepID=A0AA52EGN5_9PROT|nr:NINE protein [Temperatibacter marinus]WND02187.1 NINE protein [Temperatibacter marinus]